VAFAIVSVAKFPAYLGSDAAPVRGHEPNRLRALLARRRHRLRSRKLSGREGLQSCSVSHMLISPYMLSPCMTPDMRSARSNSSGACIPVVIQGEQHVRARSACGDTEHDWRPSRPDSLRLRSLWRRRANRARSRLARAPDWGRVTSQVSRKLCHGDNCKRHNDEASQNSELVAVAGVARLTASKKPSESTSPTGGPQSVSSSAEKGIKKLATVAKGRLRPTRSGPKRVLSYA